MNITKTIKEIAALLNRCPNSISAKKQRLNLKKYTEDYVWKDSEIALLKQYATTKSLTELSILLNRTKSAIKNYCHKHHIKCRRTDLWPEADKQFIKDNYANMTAKQIATALNRSYHSVIAQIHLFLSVWELKRKTNKS